MAFNNQISRTDAAALIPEEASREILSHVPESSVVMSLGRRLPDISRGQYRLPVVTALPEAYWINPATADPQTPDTGLKQTHEVNWDSVYVYAEEMAVIVPIPEAVKDDLDYDIWGEVQPLLVEAFGRAFDNTVLRGTNAPASFPNDLVTGATAAGHVVSVAAFDDVYDALFDLNGVHNLVEEDGYMVNGHIAAPSMMSRLRACRAADGAPVFSASMVNGVPYFDILGGQVRFPRNGCMAGSPQWLFSGDWSQLVWAMRQDLTYKILDQAVITDASGNVQFNLAQQDMVALRAVMRIGWALPNPINPTNANAATRYPFSILIA